ncbi:MAG: glycosyl transferase family 1 [Clostridiales bacterium GWE2_32_10]|nr:MAG: glycosyl transferase family 1 [Clostridiales bacterium GWE2_32_10]HBY19757.1 glycosyl transferase family 1 [Clostridiales bacterium]
MKVLLYAEWLKYISISGIGRAVYHQKKALEENNIAYTTDCNDDFDIVHINTLGPKSYLLARKNKKLGKKVIIHAHSTEEDFRNSFVGSNLASKIFKKWIITVYSLADQLITPTPYSKRILLSYGLNPNIEYISNGIDLKYFKKDIALGQTFREKYGFTKEDKIVIAVGLPIERKGILDFVELAKRLPKYKFVWCGHVNSLYLPAKVKKVLKNHPKNVHFLGYVEKEMMRGAYSGSDLFITLSYEECEGIVLLEALASRQKVLIRDIGAYEGWMSDGVNCYMAKDNNEFEEKIVGLVENRLEDLSEKGYEVVKERDITKIGEKLISIYEETLNKKH